jgi:hypothetical protein
MIRRPFVPLSVRDKLLRLLIKAFDGSIEHRGFLKNRSGPPVGNAGLEPATFSV